MTGNGNSRNRQFRLAARPVGMAKRTDWDLVHDPVPEPGEGQFLTKVLYLSLDPAMRGWMNEGRSYVPPVQIGEVMRALGAGRVLSSNHPDYEVGDHVVGLYGVQEYAVSDGKGDIKVDPGLVDLPVYLGTLGMPGMTAYFGLLDVGEPKQGDTVVVSGAAGAVGTVAGQIAKIKGCRVVGIAGGAEKCRFVVDELGFDAAIDYKADDVGARLDELCPNGIDVFFDNVGGATLQAAVDRMARFGRIVLCGQIAGYDNSVPIPGPQNMMRLIYGSIQMRGFLLADFEEELAEGWHYLGAWLRDGVLVHREDVRSGFTSIPQSFPALFDGSNAGTLLVTAD